MEHNHKSNARVRAKAERVYATLKLLYPNARCTLEYLAPEQFFLAAILSPQCTDIITNKVSRQLWHVFPSLISIALAPRAEIEQVVKACGMYKVKSRYVQESVRKLLADYAGVLPSSLDELMSFPGVGRKVALLILLEVFGKVEGIIIDTHNIRLANRLGLCSSKNPMKVEADLMVTIPQSYWKLWSHLMVHHGRACCTARGPKCSRCPIVRDCLYKVKILDNTLCRSNLNGLYSA